jgi:hypothetical protein
MEAAVSAPASTNTRLSVYDGRLHIAVIEQRDDGWHVTVRNRHIGVATDRKGALQLMNISINPNGNSKGTLL